MRSPRLGPCLAVLLATACTKPSDAPPRSNTTTLASGVVAASAPPAARPAAPPTTTRSCAGLDPTTCTRTAGCLLDQVTYQQLRCREAENTCERAVLHAELIGRDADPSITAERQTAAHATCQRTSGCAVTSGRCSCPCALLGHCDCNCGGGYLPRCAPEEDKILYDGAVGGTSVGPLAELGRALIAVREAPRDQAFRVTPLPNPAPLVGQKRHPVELALGNGRPCREPLSPPCEKATEVTYPLYRLPTGNVGAGPTLVLRYDGQTCAAATIRAR